MPPQRIIKGLAGQTGLYFTFFIFVVAALISNELVGYALDWLSLCVWFSSTVYYYSFW